MPLPAYAEGSGNLTPPGPADAALSKAQNDPREVIADPRARYFGAILTERTLLPADDARLGETRFEDWLSQPMPQR